MNTQFNNFDEKNGSVREASGFDQSNGSRQQFNTQADEVKKPDQQYGSKANGTSSKDKSSDKKQEQQNKEAEKKNKKTLRDKLNNIKQAGQKIIKMTVLTVGSAVTVTVSSYASGGEFFPELQAVIEEYGGDFLAELEKPLVEPIEGIDSDIIINLMNTPEGDPNLPGYVADSGGGGSSGDNGQYSSNEAVEVAEAEEAKEEEIEELPVETSEAEASVEETSEAESSEEASSELETSEAETSPAETSPAETSAAETSPAETSAAETSAEETKSNRSSHSSGGGGSYVPVTEAETEAETECSHEWTNVGNHTPETCLVEGNEYGYEKCSVCGLCVLSRGDEREIQIEKENESILYDHGCHGDIVATGSNVTNNAIRTEGNMNEGINLVDIAYCNTCGRYISVHFSALENGCIEIYAYEKIDDNVFKSNPKNFGYSNTISITGRYTETTPDYLTAKEVGQSTDTTEMKEYFMCTMNRIKRCYITYNNEVRDFAATVRLKDIKITRVYVK